MPGAARPGLDRLVSVREVAAAHVACVPGEVVVVQPGREPLPFRFPGVPGGRTAGPVPALPDRLPIGTRPNS
ncbi:hypothetical protein [Amycolatopsis sp. NPDC051903]|uniref:hypothetical protein n=1 Tax=Amycolatopsis sp. NPDC051903 TaxID=3363936 RepID=UPI00378F7F6A